MASYGDRSVILRLSAQQLTRSELLAGLEAWQQLGLISQEQVIEFCQDYLVCSVSTSAVPTVLPVEEVPQPFSEAVPEPVLEPVAATIATNQDFDEPVSPAPRSSPLARWLTSFMAEVSIIWLLFLGVFMVVVSSGVLAATQWQNFSAIGQYSILFAYTIAFAIASFWTARQTSLRLTSRMLQLATLLIVPVNFWTMDGLKVSSSWVGLTFSAIASLVLTLILLGLLQPHSGLTRGDRRLTVLNSIGLSWLHWGWSGAVPIVATYVGIVGTAVLLGRSSHLDEATLNQPDVEAAPPQAALATPTLILSALLLMGRAVLVAQVPIQQLGLALGICGWLLNWLNRHSASPWRWVGSGLLLLGWLTTIANPFPWQTIAISGLGLWLLVERLRVRPNSATLVAIALVGLQAYVLLWRLLPQSWQMQAANFALQVAGDRGMPEALFGVGLFPYLLLLLGGAAWLRRALAAPKLAETTEILALVLGVSLTLISWENPLWRSLNLTASALTLLFAFRRRRAPLPLLYLTHLAALAGILSWVHLLFPNLSQLAIAQVLLLVMAIEWSLSVGTRYVRWRRSAWHLGLLLAGCSYLLLLLRVLDADTAYENLIGLLIPIGLTILSRFQSFTDRRVAAWLSAVMLMAQLLTLNRLHAWLISLAVAALLMLLNTHTLRRRAAAVLMVGFALAFEAIAIDLYLPTQTTATVLALGALNVGILWLLRQGLLRYERQSLAELYCFAVNGWAIALCTLNLLLLTAFCLFEPTVGMILAVGLTLGAIAYRIWQQPTNWGFYGFAWGAEILAIALVQLRQGEVSEMAIATLALGLVAQLAGDVWVSRSGQPHRSSWQVIPLLYAAGGGILAHLTFTSITGLYTLAAALIGIGVGRRLSRLKPLLILSVLLVSVAVYEQAIYQLLQAEGETVGDGVMILAGLAGVIAIVDRVACRWLTPYLRLTSAEFHSIANLHWAIGSGLALMAAVPFHLSSKGTLLGISVVGLLGGYALAQGRRAAVAMTDASTHQEVWTYAGIGETIAALGYGLYRLSPDFSLRWAGAIAAIVAAALYFAPWQKWGWSLRPWQNMAMGLPVIAVGLTSRAVTLQSLLIAGAFYAALAQVTRRIRLSYLSIVLLDWALLIYLQDQGWGNLLKWGMVVGGSLLYGAQVDPALQIASARQQRHWLRSLAAGLISLTVLYQAELETGTAAFIVGALVLGLGLGLVVLGIVLRVRAFLYIGTAVFMLRILRLLWLFVGTYSALLWAVGIVLGLLFIWIAATYESRRSQMNALWHYWMTELESWE